MIIQHSTAVIFKSNRCLVLETMRQPLEEGRVTISLAAGTMTFPSQFMLVAAMNPPGPPTLDVN
jgi:predicted ATPase with chaperone activity